VIAITPLSSHDPPPPRLGALFGQRRQPLGKGRSRTVDEIRMLIFSYVRKAQVHGSEQVAAPATETRALQLETRT
jgi:hypothetical protein